MRLNDRLGQRQAEADALRILGKTAAVKPLEDVVQILRVNAAAVVLYADLHRRGQRPPFDANGIALPRVVERVFHDVADRFAQPVTVAGQADILRTRQRDFLLLLSCAVRKVQLQVLHHVRDIFLCFFKYDRPCIQLCDLQQVLHQCFDAVELLLGQIGELLHGGRFDVLVL